MSTGRLHRIRARYDAESSLEKLEILSDLDGALPHRPSEIVRLHVALCFIRAFPDSTRHYRLARRLLESFEAHVASLPANARDRLWDTGIAGTELNYRFSYEIATWLARRTAGSRVALPAGH